MRKVTIQPKDINCFFLTALLVSLVFFPAKADVVYAMSLKGAEHQIGNLLEWSTSFEQNSQVFIVEKSNDGTHFTNVATVEAAGFSNEDKSYRFVDLGVNDKQLFYRLKQVDNDGKSSFSDIVLLTKKMANQFMVAAMSNTVTSDQFNITIEALNTIMLEYSLKTKEGEIISTAKQELYAGLNDIQIDLKDEIEGVYFVTLHADQEKEMLVIHKVDQPTQKKENLVSKPLKKGG